MKAFIAGVSSYLPKTILDNDMLAQQFPEWSVEKIFAKTGIRKRHIAGDDEGCLSMAVAASEALFLKYKVNK